jgi:phage terminase large subunit-like protein
VWGKAVVNAFKEFGADCVVAEGNNGGELVATNIHSIDPNVPVTIVRASRGKLTRAEPIANLFEQGRIFHIRDDASDEPVYNEPEDGMRKPGDFWELESQLTTWQPGMKSPDRLDAYVWTFTDLMLEGNILEIADSPLPSLRHG